MPPPPVPPVVVVKIPGVMDLARTLNLHRPGDMSVTGSVNGRAGDATRLD